MLHSKASKVAILATGSLLAVVASCPPAQADVIFRSIPNLGGYASGEGCSTCAVSIIGYGGPYRIYDLFSINNPTTIDTIQFSIFSTDLSTNIQLGIFGIATVGGPGSAIFETVYTPSDFESIVPGSEGNFGQTSIVTKSLHNLSLQPGAYDFSIYNNNDLIVPIYTSGANLGSQTYPGGYVSINASLGFELDAPTTPVPEPSTWITMLLGFVGLASWRERYRAVRLIMPAHDPATPIP